MDTVLHSPAPIIKESMWNGGVRPFNMSYGKMMMWFFILSDFFTFMGFLIGYTALKESHPVWPNPDDVFKSFPFASHHFSAPLLFVGIMTFILIVSSFTMVIAVDAGHRKDHKKVTRYMFLTILGGGIFLSCQAWEWSHLIHGVALADTFKKVQVDEQGIPLKDSNGKVISKIVSYAECIIVASNLIVTPHQASLLSPLTEKLTKETGKAFTVTMDEKLITMTPLGNNKASDWLEYVKHDVHIGSRLTYNPYGQTLFSSLFFLVTGFHGFHVLSGLVILLIIAINVYKGKYAGRGHFEMVEKAGLYWHFVDLVWVFVFTFFYLLK